MPNLVRVGVDGPEDLLNAGMYNTGALVRLQYSATSTGVYADVGTAALVAGTTVYTIYHAAGTQTTWYRTRYENSGGTVTSDWSDVFQAGGEDAGYLCSLYDVKQRLGIASADATSDERLLEIIRAVTAAVERVTGRDFTGDLSDQVYTFDVAETGDVLEIDRGIQSVTTLELAGGTGGAYTATTSYVLRPRGREWTGEPYTSIVLTSGWFAEGYDTVRLTGRLGWASVPSRIAQIAEAAVVRGFRAQSNGGADYAMVGPDGGMKILRDLSPGEITELQGTYGVVTVA